MLGGFAMAAMQPRIFLIRAARDDLERIIRQRSLQSLRLHPTARASTRRILVAFIQIHPACAYNIRVSELPT